MLYKFFLCAAVLTSCFVQQAQCALEWSKLIETVKPKNDAKSVDFVFSAVNNGKAAVSIFEIGKSCDCMSVKLSASRVEPGKTFLLNGTIDLKGLPHAQAETLTVRDDAGKVVTLGINILESERPVAAETIDPMPPPVPPAPYSMTDSLLRIEKGQIKILSEIQSLIIEEAKRHR